MELTVIGPDTIHLKPQNFKAVEVNNDIDGGWRDGILQNENPVQINGQLQEYLESPIEMRMKQGVVDSIKVDGRLPTWAVNMKKAQASHFILDTTGVNVVVGGNLNRKTNSLRPDQANQESGFFYETMEQTVHGECETYYTVSQNGPFDAPFQFQRQAQPVQDDDDSSSSSEEKDAKSQQQSSSEESSEEENKQRKHRYYENYQQYATYKNLAQNQDSGSAEDSRETVQGELPWPKAFRKFCQQGDQIYEIVKSVNFTTCSNKPVLGYSTSAGLFERLGDNSVGSLWERTVNTRFLACGRDRKQYTILNVVQDEQANAGHRLEQKIQANSVQNLTLQQITKAQGQPEPVQQPKEIHDLTYTFDPKEQRLQRQGQLQHAFAAADIFEENDEQNSDEQQQFQQNGQYQSRRFFYSQERNQNSRQRQSGESSEQDDSQSQQQQSGEQYGKYGRQSRRQQQQQQQRDYERRQGKSRRPRAVSQSQESEESSEEAQERRYQSGETYHTDAENRKFLPMPSLTNPPLSQMLISGLQTEGMRNRVQKLMKEIVEDILDTKQSLAETETISKITTVSRILRRLPYSENERLYREIASKDQTEEQQTARNVFLDALVMSGTNPSVKLIFDLIKKKEIQGEEAAQLLMALPLNIRTPTQQLAKEFFDLVDSDALQVDHEQQAKTTAVLAFSKFLHHAYVNTRIRNSRYPVQIYGQFGDAKFVQRNFAQYFVQQVQKHLEQGAPENKHWIIVHLNALGNLGVPEVVPVVQKVLDESIDPYIKTQAVFALKGLLQSRQAENIPAEGFQAVDRDSQDFLTDKFIEEQVLPVLMSVAFDRGEFPVVRMAAISLLLYTTDADITIWQQLAYSTWFAASQEVHAFIYTSLHRLAHIEGPLNQLLWPMVRKARTVVSLAKPIVPGYAKSRNAFAAAFAEHLQTGYAHQVQYFGAQDSNIPQFMYYRNFISRGNGGIGFSPFEISAHGHTIQKLVDFFIEEVQQQQDESGEPNLQEAHPDVLAIRQILGLQKRQQDEEIEGSIQFTIRNEMQRIFSVNEQKIQELIKHAQNNLYPQMVNGIPFNYQKTYQFVEHEAEFPSGLGIPVSFSYRQPVHLSLRGTIKLVQDNGARDTQVVAEVHAVYGWKSHTRFAYKAPFAGKQYQAGLQRHVVAEAPLRASVRYATQGQIVVAITPAQLEKGAPSGEIDLVTYHQHPYTIIISDNLWPASHKEGGKMELIRTNPTETQETPYKSSQTFGEQLFGLSLRLDEESDYRDESEGIAQWVQLWKSFHTPSCFFNLGWLGGKDIRFVERTLTLDIQKSQTKTLAFIFGGKQHRNAQYKSLWEDSSSQSSQSSEESASSESSSQSSSQQQSEEARFQYEQEQQKKQQRKQRKEQNRVDSSDSSSSSSAEDQQQAGAVYSVALIGKRVPLRSPQEFKGIQKIVDNQYPSTIQYLLQFSQSVGRVYIRAAAGDAANEAAAALPRSSASLQAVSQAIRQAPNVKSQPDGCFEFEGEYEPPKYLEREQLLVLRKRLLAEELEFNVKGEVQFGKSCKNMPHEIKVQGKIHRNKEMTEYAQTKSRKAQKCEEDEKKGFNVSPVCIEVAQQQAAALNQGQFKIKFTELPEEFRNASYNFEDIAKSLFYPYMSHDRTHQGAGEGQAEVYFQITPDREFASLEVIKPNSRLTFEDVKTSPAFRAALPLTATQSVQQNIADRLFRADSQPSCQLESNYVNTFDNVTYRFSSQAAEGCVHVLVQDCSEETPVAVLAKDIAADQSEVSIFLGQKTKVELTPQPGKQRFGKQQSKVQVRINGQHVESLPAQIRDQQDNKQTIVYVEQMHDGGVQVFSEHIDVATNGQYIAIYASNALRNKTCGLCGDFNGEKIGEMRSPKDCPLSSGSALVASYAFQSQDKNDRSKCKVDRDLQRQIQEEERQCLTDEAYFPNNPRRYSGDQQQYQYKQYQDQQQQQQYYNQYKNQYRGKNDAYPNNYFPSANRGPYAPQYVQADECAAELAPAIQQGLQQALQPVLKARVWNAEKRQKYTQKIIQQVMDNEQQWSKQGTPEKIAHAVANQACDAMQATSMKSSVAAYLCKISKQYLINALRLELNQACEKSDCCTKTHLPEHEKIQLRSEMSYVQADSAESEETDIPYVPHGSQSKQPCQKMIQEHLEMSLPKQVFLYLQDEDSMTRTQIRSFVDDYKVRIPYAIQRTFQKANQFADNLVEAVDEAFQKLPQGQEVAHKLHQLIRDYVDVTVKQLNRVTKGKCNYNKYN
jgi:hypothetical protein